MDVRKPIVEANRVSIRGTGDSRIFCGGLAERAFGVNATWLVMHSGRTRPQQKEIDLHCSPILILVYRTSNRQSPNRLRTDAGGVVPFTASHRMSFSSRGSARSDPRKSSLFDRSANAPVIGFFASSATRGGSLT